MSRPILCTCQTPVTRITVTPVNSMPRITPFLIALSFSFIGVGCSAVDAPVPPSTSDYAAHIASEPAWVVAGGQGSAALGLALAAGDLSEDPEWRKTDDRVSTSGQHKVRVDAVCKEFARCDLYSLIKLYRCENDQNGDGSEHGRP